MAAVTLTEVKVDLHGSLWSETGRFDSGASAGNFHIKTKLGRLIFCAIQGIEGESIAPTMYLNSESASTVEDDPGSAFIGSGSLAANQDYIYFAVQGR